MIVALLLLQAAPVPPVPDRFSILADPCAAAPRGRDEILVCGRADAAAPRLPLPGEREPQDRPRQPINEPRAALENAGPVCPPGGCTGVDLFSVPVVLIRGIGALINPHSCCENGKGRDPVALVRDIGRTLARKTDRTGRVAIDLDAPAPASRIVAR